MKTLIFSSIWQIANVVLLIVVIALLIIIIKNLKKK